MDRLAAIAGLATVELSVLPFATPLPVFPLGTFDLHDNDMVFIETLTGEQRLDEPEEVSLYVRFLDLLRDTAATGRDAVTLIRRVMAELQGLTRLFWSCALLIALPMQPPLPDQTNLGEIGPARGETGIVSSTPAIP